ncbi:cyclic nucleotide-binding domain protein [Bacteriovorax sp. BSW11_IV]|uniref:Crp/Fnr family transcriptional regulator n=1 Tax=Bacteriovorax sp. BSW11_IV TaxID=1353529 RepID=UPI00038A2AF2|nr:cyclic nucleotide-binding domain-containing protein [Bacteriovorax sp. BSW11_IV]EQC43078.1 cyclic nucleotide-binding domain protein [Bacteriovorax sp. BSW11_IV]
MRKLENGNVLTLDKNTVDEISSHADVHTYPLQSNLYYEGQIPVVGYLLLEGHIQLLKNKKVKSVLSKGTLLGVHELMTNSPAQYSAQILPNTKVCFLDKSTILEFIHEHDTEDVGDLFKKLMIS